MFLLIQVVLGKRASDVAKNVINHMRLPLLSPEELKDVEVENNKDHLIPVSNTPTYLTL